jgi:rsbT antagonist protein RsbS
METTAVQKIEDMLVVLVPRNLLDNEVVDLRRQVLQKITQHESHWVLLDFSLVEICDSFFGRFIQSVAKMVRMMGAEVVVCGLQDEVVETLVLLGMTLNDINVALNLDRALAMSRARRQANEAAAGPAEANGADQADLARPGGLPPVPRFSAPALAELMPAASLPTTPGLPPAGQPLARSPFAALFETSVPTR